MKAFSLTVGPLLRLAHLRPGGGQEDAAGHSASSPMDVDVDYSDIKDHATRCCSTLFTTAC